ncbi:bifunctional DNA primase/polymerase [Mycobacteroides chelonae]|uniref:bifunctional DNA primase/polymerase n=1 Tax=Mycobacteroides chelonae TaxID=1774 RepID=UPI000694DB90|nr:bifunctional DNA primase/polymerase [Mycobacteroides chelonae]MBF9315244.1 bifunctional DNA primase/polymerase [Mycobacteroides chelonae]OHT73830.1 hypothetical protein BKG66_06215 [Mycobacteroides chelonae]OHT76387.1 hypothetical protein BKG67_03050 [Mycobacteroides chelonae]OHT91681.1 hypothetical protein BKG70_03235 [Mycobacteroides chelonae]
MIQNDADNGQTQKLARRKASDPPKSDAGQSIVIPEVSGLSLADAAHAYATAGIGVLPVNPARPKNPGSYVGKGWPDKSSADADQTTAWWQRWPNASIALHTGKSGVVAFDLDIDVLPGELAWMREGLFQASRSSGERGHYVFATTETFVSGDLTLAGGTVVGQIRSGNSVIIAQPSAHPKADSEGGQYRWHRPGVVPPLPETAHSYLRTVATRLVPRHQGGGLVVGDETVRQFIAQTTENSRPKALVALTRTVRQVRAGTRDETRNALRIAAGEARIGLYPFTRAIDEIESAARESYTARGEDFDSHIGAHEYQRLVINGVKIALGRSMEDLRAEANRMFGTNHRDTAGTFENLTFVTEDGQAVDAEAFWSARDVLADLRQYAQARQVAPWAVLGYVLARAVCAIPPHVVLPALVGSEASLNLFVALVGKSGGGKGGASGAAHGWLRTNPDTVTRSPGSGEGMAKEYAYKQRSGGIWSQVGLRTAVLFDAPEIDSVAALKARSGSTLMPQLRSAYSGEELGFSYADPTKAIRLCAHRYRLCLTVGVQPGRGSGLLDDADGGTPQRFVWLPTTDPDNPAELPEIPAVYELPMWPVSAGASKVVLGSTSVVGLLDVPAKAGDLYVLGVPDVARNAIREHRYKTLRGDSGTDPLDGHRLLCRLKVAAALMWLDRRNDAVSEQDWELAGTVMAVSDVTRRSVVAALADKAQAYDRARGRADAIRADAADEVRADLEAERVEKITKNIVSILDSAGGEESRSNIRRKLRDRDRAFFDERVEAVILEAGIVEVVKSAGRGSKGYRLRLVESGDSK